MTVPVDVDPDAAREAAASELADPAYQAAEPSWLGQAMEKIGSFFGDVLSAVGGVGPGALVALVILAVVVVVAVRLRVGGLTRSRRTARPVFESSDRSADDHRQAAELARAQGDLAGAVRERFRALVRELASRGVLDDRSGWTVDEIAALAGQRVPNHAGELRAAATLFDDVVYGGHPATEAGYRDLAELDTAIQHERVLVSS